MEIINFNNKWHGEQWFKNYKISLTIQIKANVKDCLLQILTFQNFLPETLPAPNMVLTRTQWLAKRIPVSIDKIYKSKQFEDIWSNEKNAELNTGFLIPSSGSVCDCRDH